MSHLTPSRECLFSYVQDVGSSIAVILDALAVAVLVGHQSCSEH